MNIKKSIRYAKITLAALLGITVVPAVADVACSFFSNSKPAIVQSAYSAEISQKASEISDYFLTASNLQNLNPEEQVGAITNIYSAIVEARVSPTAERDLETAVSSVFPKVMSKSEFGQNVFEVSKNYKDPQFNQMCVEVANYFGAKPSQVAVIPTSAPSPVIPVKPVESPKPVAYASPQAVNPIESKPVAKVAPAPPPSSNLERIVSPQPVQYTNRRIGTGSSQGNIQFRPNGFSASTGRTENTIYGSKTNRTNVSQQGPNNVGVNNYSAERNRQGDYNSQQINIQAGRNSTNTNIGRQEYDAKTGNRTNLRVYGNGRNNAGFTYQNTNPQTGGYNINFRNVNGRVIVGGNFNERHNVYERVPVTQPGSQGRSAYPALNDRYLRNAQMLESKAAEAGARGNTEVERILYIRAAAIRATCSQPR